MFQFFRRPRGGNIYTKNSFSWVQFFVYVWAFRLGLSGLAVLIPGFSLMGLLLGNNKSVMISTFDHVQTLSWKDFLLKLRDIRYGQLPVLISGVPLLPAANTDFMLKATLPSFVRSGKRSLYRNFVYYDYSKVWHTNFGIQNSRFEIVKFQNDFDLNLVHSQSAGSGAKSAEEDCLGSMQCEEKRNYYISEPVENPISNPFLTTLVPSASIIMEENVKIDNFPPSVMLWIASDGVAAHPHFDMEDNFLLQLSGIKTVTLTHPSAYKIFTPFSILHPMWRQSVFSNLTNFLTINEAIARYNAVSSKTSAKSDTKPHSIPQTSFEVTLSPGQMLFIPAFYFHSTVSEEGSISINLWFQSAASKIKTRLSKIPMPFMPQESTGAKLASLGASVRLVAYKLEELLPSLLNDLITRYDNAILRADANQINSDVRVDCVADFAEAMQGSDLCTDIHHAVGGNFYNIDYFCNIDMLAESSASMRRHAMTVYHYLTGDPVDSSIRLLLLMDYIEEIFEATMSPLENPALISPCALLNFVNSCIYYQKQ